MDSAASRLTGGALSGTLEHQEISQHRFLRATPNAETFSMGGILVVRFPHTRTSSATFFCSFLNSSTRSYTKVLVKTLGIVLG